MKGNMGNMMKQMQRLQADLQRAQEELANAEVTGESGGGMVKIVMNGRHEVRSVAIDPSLVGDDREMLEDLLVAAFNDAARRIAKQSEERMSGMLSGMPMPPGMRMPF